jgi:hypothetical protein
LRRVIAQRGCAVWFVPRHIVLLRIASKGGELSASTD